MSAPAQRHSATSCAAALSVEDSLNRWQGVVLKHLRRMGNNGATDEEMQRWLGLNPSTQRPRRVELVNKGLVKDSGRTRPTRSGRRATVWVAR